MDARRREERITAVAALGVALLMVPSIALLAMYPAPQASGSVAAIAQHLDNHRSTILTAMHLAALAWGGLFLVFGAAFWSMLRRAEGESAIWSSVAFGGCLVTAAAILVFTTIYGTIAYRAPFIDSAVLSTLYDAAGIANQMTACPNAIYTIAAALVIYRTGVLPRWLGHGAVLVALIHLVSTLSLARTGMWSPWGLVPSIAPLSHTAWLAGIGFVLLRR